MRRVTMEALSASETSVNFYHIKRRNMQEDCSILADRRDNLKSGSLYSSRDTVRMRQEEYRLQHVWRNKSCAQHFGLKSLRKQVIRKGQA
jgi:hypothetical protein